MQFSKKYKLNEQISRKLKTDTLHMDLQKQYQLQRNQTKQDM